MVYQSKNDWDGCDFIQKNELLQIHADLSRLKKLYERYGYVPEFNEYYELEISPLHVHRSKEDHKQAIFALSNALSIVAEEQNEAYTFSKIIDGMDIDEIDLDEIEKYVFEYDRPDYKTNKTGKIENISNMNEIDNEEENKIKREMGGEMKDQMKEEMKEEMKDRVKEKVEEKIEDSVSEKE
ncbi:hypothetical protein MsAg5_17170 [Methanosarcinaceae archaeon Ag5]|uniref:Metal-binding protein n=1 Tax=Methanolapillus africanus TaxID=3028297 RepID=A0AAE4SDV3_9EURY|nr:hypothetical protein [Methanosarcinaceae archaeon Ag5]